MKNRNIITAFLVLFSLIIVFATSDSASASSIPTGHERWVTLTRNVKVYKSSNNPNV